MTWRKIKFLVFVLATVFCTFAMIACGDGNWNGNKNNVTVKGYVRTASFERVQDNVYYDGELKVRSSSDGSFEIEVPNGSDEEITSGISLEGSSFTYVQYDSNERVVVIVKLDDGMTVNDFYFLSGKMVLHSDGETVASGTELRIDGNTVKSFSDDRNFDIGPVYKDSIVSAYKEGGEFINASLIPHNDICFADKLSDVSETTEVAINGEKVNLKHITGVTFRLKDI